MTDFERTGVSDLPWPEGNPPPGAYRVIGHVPGEPRQFRGPHGAQMVAHKITIRDHQGTTHTVEHAQHANRPGPCIGNDFAGRLERTPFGVRLATTQFEESDPEGDQMQLPDTKTSRQGRDPRDARVMLAGTPKVGKTTLAAAWAPDTTLILDTHKGTALLEDEHYVQPVDTFKAFEDAIDELCKGDHQYRTVVIDLIDDVWKFADLHAAQKKGQVAAGLIDWGKGMAEAEGLFRRAVGKLLATPYGIWFVTHTDTVEDGAITRYVPKLDKRVKTYVQGACDFVLLAEALGARRVLHTAPSAKFEAGTRVPLPEPLELDARVLYVAIARGLGKPAAAPESAPVEESQEIAA